MKKIYLLLFLVTISLAVAPCISFGQNQIILKDSAKISFYPVPADDYINIKTEKISLNMATMQMIDSKGKVFLTAINHGFDNVSYVDISKVSSGPIFIWILDQKMNPVYKGKILKIKSH